MHLFTELAYPPLSGTWVNAGLLLARQLRRKREKDGWAAHAQFLLSCPPIRYLAAPR